MHQTIGEDIDMLVRHVDRRMQPIKFRWQDRVYRVNNITGQWQEKEGVARRFFFALECGGDDIFEVSFSTKTMNWQLELIASLPTQYNHDRR